MLDLEDAAERDSNYTFLHLDRSSFKGKKRDREGGVRGGGDTEPGDLMPGIWTSLENKAMVLDGWIRRMMDEQRFHMHRDLVTYSATDSNEEMRLAMDHELDLDRMRIMLRLNKQSNSVATPAAVHASVAEARQAEMEQLTYKQFLWMRKEIIAKKKPRDSNSDGDDIVRFVGKGGTDPDTGEPKRDDIVMGIVMILLGAFDFYTHVQFTSERQSLKIR